MWALPDGWGGRGRCCGAGALRGTPGPFVCSGDMGGWGGRSTSPNLVNALIVFGALEDKNGISQSLWHGTEAAR